MTPPAHARRNEKSREAIIAAAFELCAERGFAATTIEAIAARAGVGKQTIYRWWGSKAEVLIEGVRIHRDASAGFPDTGDIRADMATQTGNVMRLFHTEFGAIWRGLIAAAQTEEAAAEGVRRILRVSIDEGVARLERARELGQLRAGLDPELAIELLYGPIYHTWLLRTRPVDEHYMTEVLAALGPALFTEPTAG
ncbi:TetR family transcriptional regulator [Longispora fulva]|uniref:AcrR family transcriptional regulator n=1 Tax=Longispora fulva TaxID=619741 RepID=A0A8J7GH87_9ACTN|nr:TetR/AcrR family transcriptional regulator [Longispora fulva]MBG6136193.1 AcrR family transcriptional regulator [Longispora fulva]GIG63317.1 TetR family transcriptional regulator [Longispora fulva]